MKLSVTDLQMALQWIKEHSNDVDVIVKVDGIRCELKVATPDQEIVTITLFDTHKPLNAKITKEDYLHHNVKLK